MPTYRPTSSVPPARLRHPTYSHINEVLVMKCENCHINEATVFMTQNINGEVIEMNLCETCAEIHEQPVMDEALSFEQFLSGFMETGKGSPSTSVVACPGCGMSLKDFKGHSKVGCAQCYSTFEDYLYPVVKRIHGTVHHTGKVPGRIGHEVQSKKLLEQYESQLKISLMKEDYEKAAMYRDKIRDIKRGEDL